MHRACSTRLDAVALFYGQSQSPNGDAATFARTLTFRFRQGLQESWGRLDFSRVGGAGGGTWLDPTMGSSVDEAEILASMFTMSSSVEGGGGTQDMMKDVVMAMKTRRTGDTRVSARVWELWRIV